MLWNLDRSIQGVDCLMQNMGARGDSSETTKFLWITAVPRRAAVAPGISKANP